MHEATFLTRIAIPLNEHFGRASTNSVIHMFRSSSRAPGSCWAVESEFSAAAAGRPTTSTAAMCGCSWCGTQVWAQSKRRSRTSAGRTLWGGLYHWFFVVAVFSMSFSNFSIGGSLSKADTVSLFGCFSWKPQRNSSQKALRYFRQHAEPIGLHQVLQVLHIRKHAGRVAEDPSHK